MRIIKTETLDPKSLNRDDYTKTSEKKIKMRIVPLTLQQANDIIKHLHRHHKPVIGHRFSIGLRGENDYLIGAAVIGRPVAREVDQYVIAEVTRLVTDGTKNACSMLYGAAARICKEMGFKSIQTYILQEESGISLKAAGWIKMYETKGGDWNNSNFSYRRGRRTDQPMQSKQLWEKKFL